MKTLYANILSLISHLWVFKLSKITQEQRFDFKAVQFVCCDLFYLVQNWKTFPRNWSHSVKLTTHLSKTDWLLTLSWIKQWSVLLMRMIFGEAGNIKLEIRSEPNLMVYSFLASSVFGFCLSGQVTSLFYWIKLSSVGWVGLTGSDRIQQSIIKQRYN